MKHVNRLLKKLRNYILRIICVWSLFFYFFKEVYLSLHFLSFILETSFSSFYVLCVFCVMSFEVNVIVIVKSPDNEGGGGGGGRGGGSCPPIFYKDVIAKFYS